MDVVEDSRTPSEIQPPRRNNFIQYSGGGYIIQRIKYLIAFQSFLGINRLYLIGCRNCAKRFCYSYNAVLVLSTVNVVIISELYSASDRLYMYTAAIEYLLLAFHAFFLQRKWLNKFFLQLQSFDEKLNICEDIKLTSPMHLYIFGITGILLFNLFEHILYIIYVVDKYGFRYSIYASYLGIVVHDVEFVFFSVLLVMVSIRLRVVKAHVAKVFSINIEKDGSEGTVKLEALCKKVNLDVSSLHQAYDLLYKCAQQLNSVMTFPMTVMIVTSGLSTILILKNLIYVLQTEQNPSTHDTAIKVIVAIGIGRSLKYILLLMFPCYFANVTKTQVDIILSMLHDILNDNQLGKAEPIDKVERRKLKAFSQLCRDNAFLYELWGVVRLDMSLPLSYSSLCTTYLIIFVQFSKFID